MDEIVKIVGIVLLFGYLYQRNNNYHLNESPNKLKHTSHYNIDKDVHKKKVFGHSMEYQGQTAKKYRRVPIQVLMGSS